jgi:hypothetical protein
MDSLISGIISFVNIVCLMAGFYFVKIYVHREQEEMRKYRKMTGLEITLLNKKLEGLNGGGNHS